MQINDSSRLSFRLMDEKDLDFLYTLDQDEEVMRYINGGHKTSLHDKINIFLPRMMSYRNESKGWGLWQVILKAIDQPIGWILVRPMGFFTDTIEWDKIELGWRFKQDFWGYGYATEAAHQIMETLISQDKQIKAFCAVALAENLPSIAIMKKLGMQFESVQAIEDPFRNQNVDCVVYCLDI
jgi:RimJ/RimL family protein N-acetyltransferase